MALRLQAMAMSTVTSIVNTVAPTTIPISAPVESDDPPPPHVLAFWAPTVTLNSVDCCVVDVEPPKVLHPSLVPTVTMEKVPTIVPPPVTCRMEKLAPDTVPGGTVTTRLALTPRIRLPPPITTMLGVVAPPDVTLTLTTVVLAITVTIH